MSNQFGFDFSDCAAAVYAELPAGGWDDPAMTTDQYRAFFARAVEAVQGVSGLVGSFLASGLRAAIKEHAHMLECCSDRTEPYTLWRSHFAPEKTETDAFTAEVLSGTLAGFECKRRAEKRMTATGVYAPELGSLVVRTWPDPSGGTIIGADYHPWRDGLFLSSYRDGLRSVYAPQRVFAAACCANKIAEANDGVASVPTFTLKGREYVNDGGYSHRAYRDCEGWTFCPLADWKGPTYSYRSQVDSWNEGRTERGDRRGLIVSIRGQLAVLDGAICVYDDNASGFTEPAEEATDDHDVEAGFDTEHSEEEHA